MIHAAISAFAANPAATLGYATIALSGHQSAQGPVVRQLRDGRVEIDAGNGRLLAGVPLHAREPNRRGRISGLWVPLFAGLH